MSIDEITKPSQEIGLDPVQVAREFALETQGEELPSLFDNPFELQADGNAEATQMHYGEEYDFAGAAFLGILRIEAIQRAVRVKSGPFITVHGSIITHRTSGSC